MEKINKFVQALIIIFTFILFTAVASYPLTKESFKYDLKWMGIKAGTAKLKFMYRDDRVIIVSRAESASWVSVFYKVDDKAKSVLLKGTDQYGEQKWLANSYRLKIREGRHRRDKEIIFTPTPPSAKYINHLEKEEKVFQIEDDTYDPLSAFFILRQKEIKDGNEIYLKIFDSKKFYRARIKILGKEKVKTKAGTFNTIVIEPELKSEGIFQRKGKIIIYLTDDERHIPVLLKSKVLIGSVVAELVDMDVK